MTYNTRYQGVIEMLQPSLRAFDLLVSSCLGDQVAVLPTYAEVAMDFIFEDGEKAQVFDAWISEHMVIRGLRGEIHRIKSTTYFNGAKPADADGPAVGKHRKPGRTAVLYSDRPSKLNIEGEFGSPRIAVHLELRFNGALALRRAGLASISDFSGFDHRRFWANNICFLEMPKQHELGNALGGPTDGDVSQAALRKRATKLKAASSVETQLFMHLMVRKTKKSGIRLDRVLRQIPISQVLKIGPNLTD
jgi:hypothetical protein